MSHITSMVLVTGPDEIDAVARLNAWCREHDIARHQEFNQLDTDAAGGFKVMTADVYAMAGNYFPWLKLTERLGSFGWHWPEDVVLVVDHETSDGARIYRPASVLAE